MVSLPRLLEKFQVQLAFFSRFEHAWWFLMWASQLAFHVLFTGLICSQSSQRKSKSSEGPTSAIARGVYAPALYSGFFSWWALAQKVFEESMKFLPNTFLWPPKQEEGMAFLQEVIENLQWMPLVVLPSLVGRNKLKKLYMAIYILAWHTFQRSQIFRRSDDYVRIRRKFVFTICEQSIHHWYSLVWVQYMLFHFT